MGFSLRFTLYCFLIWNSVLGSISVFSLSPSPSSSETCLEFSAEDVELLTESLTELLQEELDSEDWASPD